tara:strand:+ start:211 stop:852 length:642 start_codon:yes stop_codon:yes gene_type:complete
MPKTKRADQDRIRKLRQQKKSEIARQRAEKEILDHEDFGDIHSCVGEAISGLINNNKNLSSQISENNLEEHIKLLNTFLLGPYLSGKFNSCKVSKIGVEIWLHRKHARKEMSLKEIGEFVGSLVDEGKTFKIDQEDFPWFPKHPVGKVVWKSIFDLSGVLNNSETTAEKKIEILYEIRKPETFSQFLVDLRLDGKYKIDTKFQIEPGESLALD